MSRPTGSRSASSSRRSRSSSARTTSSARSWMRRSPTPRAPRPRPGSRGPISRGSSANRGGSRWNGMRLTGASYVPDPGWNRSRCLCEGGIRCSVFGFRVVSLRADLQQRSEKITLALLAAAAASMDFGCFGHQYLSGPRVAVVGGDPIVQMKAPDEFPVVTKPSLVSHGLHSDPPDEDSRVLGITVGAIPRAYPIGLLDRFEVVNDAVPGLFFVVVRCGLTGITAAYDRTVAGRVLDFRNSGALWRDTLVLKDRATGTYWSSATGEALHGPLEGDRLRPLPAVVVRASDWQRSHPGSLYMDLDEDTSEPLWMRLYRSSRWQGISGRKTGDSRHKPKEPVLTVGEDGEAIAFMAGE